MTSSTDTIDSSVFLFENSLDVKLTLKLVPHDKECPSVYRQTLSSEEEFPPTDHVMYGKTCGLQSCQCVTEI